MIHILIRISLMICLLGHKLGGVYLCEKLTDSENQPGVEQDKVKSVQLEKTLSFVKFVVGGTLDCSSLTLKRPTYQILASCYA